MSKTFRKKTPLFIKRVYRFMLNWLAKRKPSPSKKEIMNFWDKTVDWQWSIPFKEKEAFIRFAGIEKDSRVIDIGTGTGRNFYFVPKSAFMVGVDLNPKMLSVAKRRIPFLHCVRSDALSLPFRDLTFSHFISDAVIEMLPNNEKGKFLDEALRVAENVTVQVISETGVVAHYDECFANARIRFASPIPIKKFRHLFKEHFSMHLIDEMIYDHVHHWFKAMSEDARDASS